MTARPGRPSSFPLVIVPLALERRDRTNETWTELGRAFGVNPGTLKARAAEFRRFGAYKTPSSGPDGEGTTTRARWWEKAVGQAGKP